MILRRDINSGVISRSEHNLNELVIISSIFEWNGDADERITGSPENGEEDFGRL